MPIENKGFTALFSEKKNQLDHLQAKMASIIPAFPGQNVAKYFDLAIGVDFHSTIMPPSPLLPVPHIGMVFDIMSAVMAGIASVLPEPPAPPPPAEGEEPVEAPITVLSVASAIVNAMKPSVKVHGQWVANAGTGIQHLPALIAHILPVVSPMASSEMWMGSSTVLADGGPCSTQFHPALSCNIVGIPSIGRKNKPPKPKMALMAPTSMLLIITSGGRPVLAGGPPTIDLFQLMFKMALKGLGKLWKKARGKMKAPDSKTPHLGKAQPEANVKCKGEPVDVATGKVFSVNTDFELPGPIPLVWDRTYYSNAETDGPLGYNWHHSYNVGIYDMKEGWFTVRLKDGRETVMPELVVGDAYYNRQEKLMWQREPSGYIMADADKYIYRFDSPVNREGFNMVSSIETLSGYAIRFHYDFTGRLNVITDSGGRRLLVDNDEMGRILKIYTHADKQEVCLIEYAYDAAGNLVKVTDGLGGSKQFYYEGHLLVRLTNQSGLNFYWEYEGKGDDARCVHTWGDGGVLEYWFEYEEGRTVDRNSLSHVTEHYYNKELLIYKIIDANGGVTHQSYNEYSELELIVNPEGHSIKCRYNMWGKLIEFVNENGDSTVYKYDDQLNLITVITPGGATYTNAYDYQGRVIARTNADGTEYYYHYNKMLLSAISDHAGRRYNFTYDQQYNLTRLQFPNDTFMEWVYDDLGQVLLATDASGNRTAYEYDSVGNAVSILQPDGTKHHLAYDATGNMIRAWDNNGHDVAFSYGAMGVLTGRKQNGNAVRFNYDTELQLKSIANEAGEVYKFGLDALGNVVNEWGFDGVHYRYVRDGVGRIVKTLRPDSRWTVFSYDGIGNIINEEQYDGSMAAFKYNRDGWLTEAYNDVLPIRLARDKGGRVIQEWQGNYQIERQYDRDGNCVSKRSSLGALVNQQYTDEGFLAGIQVQEAESSNHWTAAWQRSTGGLELYRQLTGNVQVRTERDQLGRVQRRTIGSHGVEQSRLRYEWGRGDKLNRITDELRKVKTEFTYDPFDALVKAVYQQGAATDAIYRVPDKIGNLFRSPEKNDRKYAKGGRLTEDEKFFYHYDLEGNLLFKEFKANGNYRAEDKTDYLRERGIAINGSGTGWLYQWTANGMLQKVISPAGGLVEFYYDPLGRRIAKCVKERVTRWVWDGNVPLHEWMYNGVFPAEATINAAGMLTETEEPVDNMSTWLFEEGTYVPCALIRPDKSYSIVTDYLGTPTHAYDNEGNRVWERKLDCYGNLYGETGEKNFIPYLYQGQYIDGETGLAYNRFRYYDPDAGQYISQDPIGLLGGSRLYSYIKDPNLWIDPEGLSGWLLGTNLFKAGSTHGGIVTTANRSVDWQAHHVIPQEKWDLNKDFFREVGFKGKHSAANGVFLPNSAAKATQYGGFSVYHNGSHADFSNAVDRRIAAIEASYRVHGNKAQAKAELQQLQSRLKNALSRKGGGAKRLH